MTTHSGETLTWTQGPASARVNLEGGRLASLVVHGLELLVTEGTKPSRYGSFPMAPWCGRLAGGVLDFEGERHGFPLTSPPHANHGRGYLQAWERVDAKTIRTELGAPWPFGGHLLQRFELQPDSLRVTLEVHAAERPMPAMVGWHPWFRRQLDAGGPADLRFAARSAYATDSDQIPTGELEPSPEGPWDHCFTGLEEGPEILWPGALRLTVRSDMDHWVVYNRPEHALCIEPQSGPPNQPNRGPRLALPGQPLTGSMTLSWDRDEPAR